MSVMQYGRVLDHLIRDIAIANPALGPVHVLKLEISDGFCYIGLRPMDAPNLGLFFPSKGEDE